MSLSDFADRFPEVREFARQLRDFSKLKFGGRFPYSYSDYCWQLLPPNELDEFLGDFKDYPVQVNVMNRPSIMKGSTLLGKEVKFGIYHPENRDFMLEVSAHNRGDNALCLCVRFYVGGSLKGANLNSSLNPHSGNGHNVYETVPDNVMHVEFERTLNATVNIHEYMERPANPLGLESVDFPPFINVSVKELMALK